MQLGVVASRDGEHLIERLPYALGHGEQVLLVLHRDLAVLGIEPPEGAADEEAKELGQLELRVGRRARQALAGLVRLDKLAEGQRADQ